MMRKLLINLALMLTIALVAFLVSQWLTRDEVRIQRNLEALAGALGKSPDEHPAATALRCQGLAKFFAHPCTFELKTFPFRTTLAPTEIASEYFRVQAAFQSVAVTFTDIQVAKPANGTAQFALTVRAEARHAGGTERQTASVIGTAIKIDRQWRFNAFSEELVLER